MKVSKFISKSIQTVLFLFVFYILAGVLHSIVSDYMHNYNLFAAERGTAAVVAQTAKKGLFHSPAYYVKVDMNDNHSSDVYDGVLNRVSALQMKNLEYRDQIKGFIIDHHHFLTLYDIVFDGSLALVGIVLVLCFLLATIVWGINIFFPLENLLSKKDSKSVKKGQHAKRATKAKGRKNNKSKNKRNRNKKSKKGKSRNARDKEKSFSFQEVFLIVFFSITFILTCTFMLNGFHKLVPLGQTKTEAIIVDKHSEREWLAYRMRPEFSVDPLFELELHYKDQDGNVRRVMKEVTPHTFRKYRTYEDIPISYRNNNPLDVFIRGTTLVDVMYFFIYGKFLFFLTFSLASLVIGVIIFRKMYKKIRRRSQYK